MENLLIFTEEDDKILSLYEEISKENLDNKEYEKLVKKYPALENEALYKIKKVNKNEQNELNSIMAKPLMSISMLENEETSEQIKATNVRTNYKKSRNAKIHQYHKMHNQHKKNK